MTKMTAPTASTAAAELVARFRRQRPLRGGSLIVTMFGDAIMPRGGAVALGSLIELAAPFGLNERLVRTATARLARTGGSRGTAPANSASIICRATAASGSPRRPSASTAQPDSAWSGRWTVIVLPPMRAAERKEIREELMWRGFGELSTDVFAHPEFDSRSLRLPRRPGADALPRSSSSMPVSLTMTPAALGGPGMGPRRSGHAIPALRETIRTRAGGAHGRPRCRAIRPASSCARC